jgi:hypothetical protein
MPYSSSLTDKEWEILELLLAEILPVKQQTRSCNWTKRELLDGMFYQQSEQDNGCPDYRLTSFQDIEKLWSIIVSV